MKTVILGASTNPARYSFMAAERLMEYGHEVVPVGLKKGSIFDMPILDFRLQPLVADVDTITIYIGPKNQALLFEYIPRLRPRRVIFNPGAENPALERVLREKGIETLDACTLVMLRTEQY